METAPDPSPDIKCSFCGKTRAEVKKLIAGPAVYICNDCVNLCNDIIAEEAEAVAPALEVPELAALTAHFDAGAVGQVAAKRALIAALRLHAERVIHDSSARVPHVLLVGPRGSGKTTLGRALCSALALPSFHVDVGRLSESGYVGEDIEHLCVGLVWRASSPAEAEQGVLFLDGVEKIRAQRPLAVARDISGEGVQRELVRLLDGLELSIPNMRARHPQALGEVFHTDRVLVVAACSLESLPKGATDRVLREKLREAGLVDAVLARFGLVVQTDPPTVEELETMLTREHGDLWNARAMIQTLGGTLAVTPEALRAIATAAHASGDGGWGLQPPVARLMTTLLASSQGLRDVVVDGASVGAFVR